MWTLHSAVLHPSLILCFVYERLSCWQCPKIASLYNFLRNLPTSLPRKLLPFSKHHKVLKYYNIKSPLLNCFQFFLQVIYKLQVTEHSHGSYKQTNSMQEENLEMLQNTSEPVRSRQGTWDEMTKSDSSIAQFYTYDTFLIIHPVIKKLKMRLEISNISTWNMQPRKLHEHSVETTSVNIYIWWLVNWAEIHWRALSQTYGNLQCEVLDLDLAKRCTMPVFWMKISIMNLWVIWKDILLWVQESLKRHASLNIWSYHTEQNCICASGNVVLFTSSNIFWPNDSQDGKSELNISKYWAI